MARTHELSIRIPYADVDQMGVVYYANHLVYFERGRTEYLREMGLAYRDMESQDGILLPVKEAQVTYLAPARYDDLIRVRTVIAELSRAMIMFTYEIINQEEKPLARGSTRHIFINRRWRPCRPPDRIVRLITPYL